MDKLIIETTESGDVKERDEQDVSTPADFTSPDVLYDDLIEAVKKYHPSDDMTDIRRAYAVAAEAHKNQKRKSGEPYIIHPLCVAIILAELEMDKETIIAGLLHDVIEDTPMTYEDVADQFGDEVAMLVDGVTKLTKLNYKQDKVTEQAENLRKMFLAMAKDIRVIIIKLADRLHNMRTMQYQPREKQIEKSRETLEIYSPLANRLGISKIKIEMDDLAMKYLMPEEYNDLYHKVEEMRPGKEAFIRDMIKEIADHLKSHGIKAEVDGRIKHLFSIYRKMVSKKKTFDQIYDIFALRVKVETVTDCYTVLGLLHEKYTPVPGRFKDYIAMPKQNNYQSLHTTLYSKSGQPFEVQIRTFEMHRIAEYGIAAHWKYKEGIQGKPADAEESKLTWLRQLLEWQKEMPDNEEFINSVKDDFSLLSEKVYCFTPSGDVKPLPAGSCPVDFAYAIHSAVGNRMVGARVNGQLVNIDYKLKSGDQVEIITSQNSKGPSRDWLNIVKSPQARNKINQWFKKNLKEDNIARGKDLLQAYCKNRGIQLPELLKPEFMDKTCSKYGYRDWDSLLASVGHGGLKEGQVVNKLQDEYEKKRKASLTDADVLRSISEDAKERPADKNSTGVLIKGVRDLSVRFSKCCNPVPGDEIIGYITRGRGITIHRTDCVNVLSLPASERNRLVEAQWEHTTSKNGSYAAELTLYGLNRVGLLIDVSKIFSDAEIDVKFLNSRTNKHEQATINVGFDVRDKDELARIEGKLRKIKGVTDVARTTG